MSVMKDVFSEYAETYQTRKESEMGLMEYLDLCGSDPMAFASAAERMVSAIGDPDVVDTSRDPRLGRIFMNRTIKVYPAFHDFFGMEDTIERLVGYPQKQTKVMNEGCATYVHYRIMNRLHEKRLL